MSFISSWENVYRKSWMKVPVTQSESRYMSRIIKQPEPSMKLESLFPPSYILWKLAGYSICKCFSTVWPRKRFHKKLTNHQWIQSVCSGCSEPSLREWGNTVYTALGKIPIFCLQTVNLEQCIPESSESLLSGASSMSSSDISISSSLRIPISSSLWMFLISCEREGTESLIPVAAGWSLTLWLTHEIHEPEM